MIKVIMVTKSSKNKIMASMFIQQYFAMIRRLVVFMKAIILPFKAKFCCYQK